MIDATFVEVPRQRNTHDENAQVKAGETPADWQMPVNKSKLRQKDVEALLDHSEDESGKKRAIYADSAYRSQQKEASLATANIPSQICEKGARNHPLTAEQKASNTENPEFGSGLSMSLGRRRRWEVTSCAPSGCCVRGSRLA